MGFPKCVPPPRANEVTVSLSTALPTLDGCALVERWLVPGDPGVRTTTLWVGNVDAPPPETLRLGIRPWGGVAYEHTYGGPWDTMTFGSRTVTYARIVIDGLSPNTQYRIGEAGRESRVDVHTLPESIPTSRETALRILLGSCFSPERDHATGIVHTAVSLRNHHGRLPHLKILCGDQVYLDLPVRVPLPLREDRLREKLLGHYLQNWAPLGSAVSRTASEGYGEFLRVGSNLFVSDDHEFWNNMPFGQAQLKSTYTPRGRTRLIRAGRDLFRVFQTDYEAAAGTSTLRRFRFGARDVCPLTLFLLDGRYARTQRRAHLASDITALAEGLATAPGPCVVVLSQPLFEEPVSRFMRRFVDAGLMEMEDYGDLARALDGAAHDVVLLSGDIHGGRMASARKIGRDAQSLWEVVASPLKLIPRLDYHSRDPHRAFPAPEVRGVTGRAVEGIEGPVAEDHFAELRVWRRGPRALQLGVDYFSTNGMGAASLPFGGEIPLRG